MADTGAPHFIPYVEPTDLVRDYPAADEAQADAVADALNAIPVLAGIGSNVVQTVKTDTFSTSSNSFTALTGMSVTITPTSATSKVLLLVSLTMGQTLGNGITAQARLLRGATVIAVGDAASNRTRASFIFSGSINPSFEVNAPMHLTFIDTPAVATATTYSLEIRRGGAQGAAVVNRNGTDVNSEVTGRLISTITVIEVAA